MLKNELRDKPSGAEAYIKYRCTYKLGDKHKCDRYIAWNCKRDPDDCPKEDCAGGFYDVEQKHCKGCLYGNEDVNIDTCYYTQTSYKQHKRKKNESK